MTTSALRPPSPEGSSGTGPGDVLAMFRETTTLTRAAVMQRTGLARSTVNQRIDLLLEADLIVERDPEVVGSRGRGRPAGSFGFHADRGVLLVCDIGATGLRAAVCDLAGEIHHDTSARCDVTAGPEPVLGLVDAAFRDLLALAGRGPDDVLGVALSVPGPVDHERATVVSPPIMTGWDRFDLTAWFGATYACPLLVEKDANAMAWGEFRTHHADSATMLMVKLGTGVGSGIITGGRIHRGADGAAGDIGHTQLLYAADESSPLCRCGNTGCVEASAGGWALMRDLRAAGRAVDTVDDVVELIRTADPLAVQLARAAGRTLGMALSEAVNLLNPRVIVVGGQLAIAEEQIFAGLREMVYSRSLPLATRRLDLVRSRLDERAGSIGLALLLADHIFAPARVDASLGI